MKYLIPILSLACLGLAPQEKRSERPPVPEVGMAAPISRLNDQAGKATTVGGESDHWTVVAFFPKAATPG